MKKRKHKTQYKYSEEEVAQSYDSDRFLSPGGKRIDRIERELVNSALCEYDKEKAILLEVGLGTGRFALDSIGLGYKMAACDISMPMLVETKKKMKELYENCWLSLGQADIFHLPYSREVFDHVYCIRVLDNLGTFYDQMRALDELLRVCRVNGTVLIDIVNRHSLASLKRKPFHGRVNIKDLRVYLKKNKGVKIVKIFSRFVLSMTAFEKATDNFLNLIDMLDRFLSKMFKGYGVRVYLILKKTAKIISR